MSVARTKDAAEIRAEIEQIERVSRAIQTALWVIAAGSLVWTATTVTHLAVHHGAPKEIAWILSPLVECALIAVLLGDGILSSYGAKASGWAIGLRWFAGLSSWLMNVWDSFGFHTHKHHLAASPDAPGLLIHSIVPALLILLAEVAPRYRRQFAVIAERLRDTLTEIEPNATENAMARQPEYATGTPATVPPTKPLEYATTVPAYSDGTPADHAAEKATEPRHDHATVEEPTTPHTKPASKPRPKKATKPRRGSRPSQDTVADARELYLTQRKAGVELTDRGLEKAAKDAGLVIGRTACKRIIDGERAARRTHLSTTRPEEATG